MRNKAAILMLLALAPGLALAAAPQPRKPVDPAFFTGQWSEIARTYNARQKDCEAPTYRFDPQKASTAAFTLTCRKGSPTGPAEALRITVSLPQDAARDKFRVSALGGLLSQEYWVLDIADDSSWSILAMPGGGYLWLLARRPALDPGEKVRIFNSIRSMGYDLGKIVQPRQA